MSREASLLIVDVGNTNTVVGIFLGNRIVRTFRFASRHRMTADECYLLLRPAITESGILAPFDGSAICSVVPQLTTTYESAFKRMTRGLPVIVSGALSTGIEIKVHRPEQVGADRIANAVAAHNLYRGDSVVVDLGTATTFDVVSRNGEYLGGAIAPGIFTSAQILFEKAAMLPKLDITLPDKVIGRSTEEAIQSGIYYGAVSQIDGIVEKIIEEWGREAVVIATGGYAGLISERSRTVRNVDPDLTLKGVHEIWKLQYPQKNTH